MYVIIIFFSFRLPAFGQKVPRPTPKNDGGFEPPKVVSNEILIKEDLEKDYTPIDQPSREPPNYGSRPQNQPPPQSQRPSTFPGNRYDINGNRRPYIDNNPNKERKPRPPPTDQNPAFPNIGNGNQNNIGTKYGIKDEGLAQDVTVTNTNGQYQVIQTKYEPQIITQVDPSFTVGANYGSREPTRPAYIDRTVVVGANPNKVRGSVLEDTSLDYAGWYTEGDLIELRPTTTSTSRFYTDLNIRETEAPKTTTYANEWSTPGDTRTRDPAFIPKTKPALNTNFRGEWTATIEREPVRPTRPIYGSNSRVPYNPRENNNWNTIGSRRPPPTTNPIEGDNSYPERPTSTLKPNVERPDDDTPSSFPDTNLVNPTTRPRRPSINRPGPPFRRPSPGQEEIVFGKRPTNRPSSRLPPIQQANDIIGIPNANLQPGDGQFRPGRRPSRPTTPTLPQQPELIDRIDPTKTDDDTPVIEGTFENRPVIPFQTDNPAFTTNERVPITRDRIIEGVTTTRRPIKIPFSTTRNVESTSRTRKFPPGTFINIDPTTTSTRTSFSPTRRPSDFRNTIRSSLSDRSVPLVRPTILPPSIATPGAPESSDQETTNILNLIPRDPPVSSIPTRDPSIPRDNNRPIFPPKIVQKQSTPEARPPPTEQPSKNTNGRVVTTPRIKTAGVPFLPPIGQRPFVKDNNKSKPVEEEAKQHETVNSDSISPGIVEGISRVTAEDSDPETRCQNTCGQNEICQINARGGIECKCRPGFGRPRTRSKCESK